jgi:hypothetical protein
VWGPYGNDTLIKPAYITAMTVSTETTTKNKTTESVSINAKPKNETTESVISINKKSKKEASEPVSLTMNPNWESTDEQLYLDGHSEEYPIEVRYPIRIVNRYDRGYNIGYNIF